MKGDFSRSTFDPHKHFTRVLMQQGRVQLDADWNEQTAILLHYLESLAQDLFGWHGGPGPGFMITDVQQQDDFDFTIQPGHYYVRGKLCDNAGPTTYRAQPGFPFPDSAEIAQDRFPYLVYLHVWERHISHIQDSAIREVALGGADTATRAQLVWQVKIQEYRSRYSPDDLKNGIGPFHSTIGRRVHTGAALKAQAKGAPTREAPEAGYRGAENQLYRVEIHRGGRLADRPTFKWSRDNGSVAFPIRRLAGKTATLENSGPDSHLSLAAGDWVEIVDDVTELRGLPGPMAQVSAVDASGGKVALEPCNNVSLPEYDEDQMRLKHPLLRRWDQKESHRPEHRVRLVEGAVPIREGDGTSGWVTLEEGIQIQFQKPGDGEPDNLYRTGDYWLIPARTATGDVEWPRERDAGGCWVSTARIADGLRHLCAPLALLAQEGRGIAVTDLRRVLPDLCQ